MPMSNHSSNRRRNLHIIMYLMLLLSALAAFTLSGKFWSAASGGSLPSWLPWVAPSSFTVFVLIFAVDRWLLVHRHRFSLVRAFVQGVIAIALLIMLWSHTMKMHRLTVATPPASIMSLLKDRRPTIRAAACELLGWRSAQKAYQSIAELATHDPSMHVRQSCEQALEKLNAARHLTQKKPLP